MQKKNGETGLSAQAGNLAIVALVGFGLALTTFLIAFMTTERADTGGAPQNLRIPVPSLLPQPSLMPIIRPTPETSPTEEPLPSEQPSPEVSQEPVPSPQISPTPQPSGLL